MKRTLVHALVIGVMVAGGTAAAITPAHAGDAPGAVCILNQKTWLRGAPWSVVIRTLTAGRGFRVHGGQFDGYETWYYGHGAEAPEQDGRIPAVNCGF